MPYLIDTGWVIDHLAGDPAATELLAHLAQDGIAVSIITYTEAFQGTERAPDPAAAQAKLDRFLEAAPFVPFSPEMARCCVRLRETLCAEGKRVRSRALDLLIAATALEHDLTVVTQNIDDYVDLPGLRILPTI